MARLGYASADAGPAAASLHARRLFYQCISRHQGQMNSLNLALSQQVGERELLKQQLQDMQHRVAVAQAQKEDVE